MIEKLRLELDYKDEKITKDSINNKLHSREKAEKALESFKNETLKAVSKPMYQSEKTDSERFNNQFEDILTDLIKLFTLANKTSAIIDSSSLLYDEFIYRLKESLKEIENKIEAYSYIANNSEGFNEVKFENFNDKRSYENINNDTKILFNDPKTESIFTENFLADINKYSDSLTLKEIGKLTPEAPITEMEEQVGKYLKVKNSLYPLENITKNDSPDDVWSETILSDQPFEVEMEEEKSGAIFKFRIIFEKPMPINNISIDPFSKYDMKLIKINTYENTEDYMKGEDFATTILSESFESYFNPKYLEDAETLEFATQNIQVLEFVVNQEHYELEQFSLKNSEKNDIQMLENIYASKNAVLNLGESSSETLLELDYSNSNLLWDYLKDMVENFFQNLDIENKNNIIGNILNSLTSIIPELYSKSFNPLKTKTDKDKKEGLVSLNKYSYQYGFKNIEPSYKEYKDKGMYVSKPYSFLSNIKEVSLVADEYNPTLYHEESDIPVTSVEYYISNLKNPSPRKAPWYPILPENHKYQDAEGNKIIKGERILPKKDIEEFKAAIRFPAQPETIKVFKDGNLIDSSEEFDYETDYNNMIITLPKESNSVYNNSIYTVNYTVAAGFDPTIIDLEEVVSPVKFIDEDGNEGEKFNPDGSEMVRLKYYPYINREKIYQSPLVDVTAEDTGENPMLGTYSPNFYKAYTPITISGFGEVEYFDGDEIVKKETNIENDTSGIPYRFKYFRDLNGDGIFEDIEFRKTTKPYFFNKTDYKSKGGTLFEESVQSPLYEYSANEYPVFEYYNRGKNIFFNKDLESGEKDSEIRVKYEYLTECIRLKIVMYRNLRHNYGITPVVKNYALKTKPFN